MSDKRHVMSLIQSGRWAEAKAVCAGLCNAFANDPETWFLLAGINAQLGAMDEVVRCCQKVVVLQPANTGAHYNLGVALQSQQRYEEAVQAYHQVLSLEPGHALSLANLALALRELGQPEKAIESCRQALALRPDMVEASNTLGLLQLDRKNVDEAMSSFRGIVTRRPGYAEAHFNLGLCHERLNAQGAAAECFRRAIDLNPRHESACIRLGASLMARGKIPEAEACYRQMCSIWPDHADARFGLGFICNKQFKYDEAEVHFRSAIKSRPDFCAACTALGISLRYQGKLEEAMASLQRALELEPDDLDALLEKASLLETLGDHDACHALLQPLIEHGVEHPRVAIIYAALARRFNCRGEAKFMLQNQLERDDLAASQQMNLRFAMGKLCDELGDYDAAFPHYRLANLLAHRGFDAGANRTQFDRVIHAYSAAKQRIRPRASNRSELPVFIVGMPRSGTSLVEQILASHPSVHGAGELWDINQIAASLPNRLGVPVSYPQCLDSLTQNSADAIAENHLEKLAGLAPGAARVTDKMPHNFMNLGLIEILFPQAVVIHCVRDPRDTCLSCYFQYFGGSHDYAQDLAGLGAYYNQYLRLMEHWKSVLRIPILEVRYEDLIADQESLSRAMVEFCGLEWDDRCLRFHESGRIAKTASYDQVRRPIYSQSIGRWSHYEKHLAPLLAALGTGKTFKAAM